MNAETHTNVLVRMRVELKADLQSAATQADRKLTQEINLRLYESLKLEQGSGAAPAPRSVPSSYTAPNLATAHSANDNGPASALSDLDRAMLRVFHGLPPEKQLALLSLFKN